MVKCKRYKFDGNIIIYVCDISFTPSLMHDVDAARNHAVADTIVDDNHVQTFSS